MTIDSGVEKTSADAQGAADASVLPDAHILDADLMDAGFMDADLTDAATSVDAGFTDAAQPDSGYHICPQAPRTADELQIAVNSDCASPTGLSGFQAVLWISSLSGDSWNSRVLSSTNTSKGDEIWAEIYNELALNDRLGSAADVTVQNTGPTAPSLALSWRPNGSTGDYESFGADHFARGDDELLCEMTHTAIDVDGDSLNHSLELEINGSAQGRQNFSNNTTLPALIDHTLITQASTAAISCIGTAQDTDGATNSGRVDQSVCDKTYLSFDHQNDGVSLVTTSSQYSNFYLAGTGTIEAWVLWDGTRRNGRIYSRIGTNSTIHIEHLYFDGSTRQVRAELRIANPSNDHGVMANSSMIVLEPFVWTHVAAVWTSGTVSPMDEKFQMFVNGVAAGAPVSMPFSPNQGDGDPTLGYNAVSPMTLLSSFPGAISHFRISNTEKYPRGNTPSRNYGPESDTIVFFPLNEAAGLNIRGEDALGFDRLGFLIPNTMGANLWTSERCLFQ